MTKDVIVIGGGIVGCAVLDRLARFSVSACLLEGCDDVASGATRANSGIVHAGYDCEPGSLKARFNVRGNAMIWALAEELRVPHLKCGSLVAAPAGGEDGLAELKRRADLNGVRAEVLTREQALEKEPMLSEHVTAALYASDGGVVSPYQLAIALADRAVLNGAEVVTEAEVQSMRKEKGEFVLTTPKGEFRAKVVVNCAGAGASAVDAMVGAETFDTEFRKGEYFVLDHTERANVSTVIFPLPTAAGKGILVAPTADGNVIYGPTSTPTQEGDTSVSAEGLDEIRRCVPLTYARPAFGKCIRVYCGVRTVVGHDFVVKASDEVENLIITAGICSPGLTSAPAIAEYVEELVGERIELVPKANFVTVPPAQPRLAELSEEELNALVRRDPRWGKIVCRCEKVTEAEIVAAVNSPVPARTVDAVKRRVRAGMGRCQGGFCSTRVMEIISSELGIPMREIRKGAGHSEIAVLAVKEADYDEV